MAQAAAHGLVELRDITGSRELDDLRVLVMMDPASPVRELALITDIEEMTQVGPDTVALLTEDVARGGWMISAALRYAWERRACAIIVPEQSFTENVIELARRLGVSLLTTSLDMRRLAIDAAIQIGVARAGSLARLQHLSQRAAQANNVPTVLRLTSEELEGARVSLETSGAVALSSPSSLPAAASSASHSSTSIADAVVRVTAPITSSGSDDDTLVAQVPKGLVSLAEQVLAAVIPSLRALLADARLQSTRDALPVITIAALSDDHAVHSIDDPSRNLHLGDFTWPVNGPYFALFLTSSAPERAGTAVLQLWDAVFPAVPLARLADGWIGFIPMSAVSRPETVRAKLRARLAALRPLSIKVGTSNMHTSAETAVASVREAWLAARSADPLSDIDSVVEFSGITARLLPRLLPADLARQLVDLLFPQLVADESCDELCAAVTTYLDSCGSVSAASAALGVHRNTLQSRLRRAEALGLHLSEPDQVLPLHLLLSAFRQAI